MSRRKSTAAPAVPRIHPDLQRFARPIEQLIPHPRNARTHGPRNLDVIKRSLLDEGQVRVAIVTREPLRLTKGGDLAPAATVLVGNGMLAAARELGYTELLAAELLGRAGFGVEISPRYCAVILERLAARGLTPVLDSEG